jgi:hypothetical protein
MVQSGDQIKFVYTTYIHATPERVWHGLTDPALTSRWWRHRKGVAKLTVVHGDFGPGSRVLPAISAGWPAVLASLKTMLETGSPLPW